MLRRLLRVLLRDVLKKSPNPPVDTIMIQPKHNGNIVDGFWRTSFEKGAVKVLPTIK